MMGGREERKHSGTLGGEGGGLEAEATRARSGKKLRDTKRRGQRNKEFGREYCDVCQFLELGWLRIAEVAGNCSRLERGSFYISSFPLLPSRDRSFCLLVSLMAAVMLED